MPSRPAIVSQAETISHTSDVATCNIHLTNAPIIRIASISVIKNAMADQIQPRILSTVTQIAFNMVKVISTIKQMAVVTHVHATHTQLEIHTAATHTQLEIHTAALQIHETTSHAQLQGHQSRHSSSPTTIYIRCSRRHAIPCIPGGRRRDTRSTPYAARCPI